jgi:hypothetical protein
MFAKKAGRWTIFPKNRFARRLNACWCDRISRQGRQTPAAR